MYNIYVYDVYNIYMYNIIYKIILNIRRLYYIIHV